MSPLQRVIIQAIIARPVCETCSSPSKAILHRSSVRDVHQPLNGFCSRLLTEQEASDGRMSLRFTSDKDNQEVKDHQRSKIIRSSCQIHDYDKYLPHLCELNNLKLGSTYHLFGALNCSSLDMELTRFETVPSVCWWNPWLKVLKKLVSVPLSWDYFVTHTDPWSKFDVPRFSYTKKYIFIFKKTNQIKADYS